MRKKLILTVILFSFLFSITGCNKKPETAVEEDKATDSVSIETGDNKTEDISAIPHDDEYVHVNITSKISNKYAEDNNDKKLLSFGRSLVDVKEEEKDKFTNLYNTLKSVNNEYLDLDDNAMGAVYDSAVVDYNENPSFFEGGFYYSNSEAKIMRADKAVLSIRFFNTDFTGGAHGYYYFYGHSYDVESGEELQLTDIVKDNDKLKDAVVSEISTKYPDLSMDGLNSYLDEYGDIFIEMVNWTVGYEGVQIYFAPYDIASYAEGAQEVLIRFDKYKDLFTEKYISSGESFVYPLNSSDITSIDVDGDKENDDVSVFYGGTSEDGKYYNSVGGVIGSKRFNISTDNYESMDCYCVKKDGKTFIYAFLKDENSKETLKVIDITTKEGLDAGTFEESLSVNSENGNQESDDYSIVEEAFVNPYRFEVK